MMTKDNFVTAVCSRMGWSKYSILKKPHGKVPAFVAGELLEALFDHGSVPKVAVHYGVGINTVHRLMKTLLPDVKLLGNKTWKYYFLEELGFKTCQDCLEHKPLANYYASHTRVGTKTLSYCKNCSDKRRNAHIAAEPSLRKANAAKRRVSKLTATPLWANIEAIKTIYKNCPEGSQVDHIIPLQGENVCGLHVENNLQYLTEALNKQKGNKLLPEYAS